MCAESTTFDELTLRASSFAAAKTRLAEGVKGPSFDLPPPLPTSSSTSLRTSFRVIPSLRRTRDAALLEETTPTNNISVPT
mmetsp:Transcript_67768/g.147670  ORF Transcript_67768/g.147670 Transcript_67768/m.147670 type:complete len:81 (+) Transcript_67768:1075-1317(+)